MAVIEFIPERNQSHCAMKNLIQYCLQEAKVADRETNRRLVSGINCDGENVIQAFGKVLAAVIIDETIGKRGGTNERT